MLSPNGLLTWEVTVSSLGATCRFSGTFCNDLGLPACAFDKEARFVKASIDLCLVVGVEVFALLGSFFRGWQIDHVKLVVLDAVCV